MNEEITVACDGPALGLLLFDTESVNHDQIGFLLGNVMKPVIKSMTDDDEEKSEQKTVIHIEHCIPIIDSTLFDPYGEIDEDCYKNYYLKYDEKIIGWYSYRRNTKCTQSSLRDGLLHKSLLRRLKKQPKVFLLAKIFRTANHGLNIHNFNHTFYSYDSRNTLVARRLNISNFNDQQTDKNGYYHNNVVFPMAVSYNELINSSGNHEEAFLWVKTVTDRMGAGLDELRQRLMTVESMRLKKKRALDNIAARFRTTETSITYANPCSLDGGPQLFPFEKNADYSLGRINPLDMTYDDSDDDGKSSHPDNTPSSSYSRALQRPVNAFD